MAKTDVEINLQFENVIENVNIDCIEEGALVLYEDHVYAVEQYKEGSYKDDYWLRGITCNLNVEGMQVYKMKLLLLGRPRTIKIDIQTQ